MMKRYMLSDEGDVLARRDGYHEKLSLAVVQTLGVHATSTDRRMINFIDDFLNRPLEEGEDDDRLLGEPTAAAVERCRRHLLARKLAVGACNEAIDVGRYSVRRPGKSINHERQGMHVLRTLYRHLRANGHLAAENPWDVDGWEGMTETERWDWYRARHPTDDRGFRHAGTRFRVVGHRHYPPLLEEPEDCGRRMTAALRALPAPEALCDACETMELNGQRYEDEVPATALGWARLQFGTAYMGRNKGNSAEFSKPIVMPPAVHARVVARFEGRPHPERPDATMMDWLRERAAAGDDEALRAVPLFPNARGRVFAYPTFSGWIRRAMAEANVLIRSDVGTRRPTSAWYRHALYAKELEEEIADATTEQELQDAIARVGARFGQKSANAVRYAPKVLERHAVRLQMRIVAERIARMHEGRSVVDVAPVGARMRLAEAEDAFAALPAGDDQ